MTLMSTGGSQMLGAGPQVIRHGQLSSRDWTWHGNGENDREKGKAMVFIMLGPPLLFCTNCRRLMCSCHSSSAFYCMYCSLCLAQGYKVIKFIAVYWLRLNLWNANTPLNSLSEPDACFVLPWGGVAGRDVTHRTRCCGNGGHKRGGARVR